MTPSIAKRHQICDLNDDFRTGGPCGSGRWLFTRGVSDLGVAFAARALADVRAFDTFTADNDPYGEHDFGAFDLAGERLFWKIDYYNLDLGGGSENPADPAVTCRVLTIMLASEY
ncbi:hypothetical protein QO010_000685 [Caulobacter ginsengisoli]|uniref:DUF3768 domain-containing protein n=1 Tax=Caulobacter ginsengisoli TaxID=400775 RepID=A0ABU0ILP9_9CAUL|nr:DUF3768 domain-containing protein [Caulobacter ginsengisoli]MDQ0462937.1 hypothetical protein [Caulobacter ginsengisoli]